MPTVIATKASTKSVEMCYSLRVSGFKQLLGLWVDFVAETRGPFRAFKWHRDCFHTVQVCSDTKALVQSQNNLVDLPIDLEPGLYYFSVFKPF